MAETLAHDINDVLKDYVMSEITVYGLGQQAIEGLLKNGMAKGAQEGLYSFVDKSTGEPHPVVNQERLAREAAEYQAQLDLDLGASLQHM